MIDKNVTEMYQLGHFCTLGSKKYEPYEANAKYSTFA